MNIRNWLFQVSYKSIALLGWILFLATPTKGQNIVPTDYVITYDFSLITDTVNNKYLDYWEYVLIGRGDESRFLEASHHHNDSIIVAWDSDNPQYAYPNTSVEVQAASNAFTSTISGQMQPSYEGFYTRKNFSQQTVDVALLFTPAHEYMQQPLLQDWQIHSVFDTINKIPCQQATLRYSGRNYIAWFSTDIPISDGPYVFAGLPGLIVKISDLNEWFTFTLRRIDVSGDARSWRSEYMPSENFKITREQFIQKSRRQKNDPQMFGLMELTVEERQNFQQSYKWRNHLLLESN